MKKVTDLNAIKETAILMANLPIHPTSYDFIVDHPVFQSSIWYDDEEIINLMESDEGLQKATAVIEERIRKTTIPIMVMHVFRSSYYLTFLKFSR